MSPRKLTEDDKQEILQLYRTSEATTSTLANRYEVSSSTISRFLKNKLSQTEYEDLIQQKRLARTPRKESETISSKAKAKAKPAKKTKAKTTKATKTSAKSPSESPTETIVAVNATEITASTPTRRRRRRISTASEAPVKTEDAPKIDTSESEKVVEIERSPEPEPVVVKSDRPILKKASKAEDVEEEIDRVDVMTLQEMLGEDIDDDDDDDEDEWEDAEELDTEVDITYPHAEDFDIQIMPLASASLPRTCYLVIDRAAELIVKPLRDFADLGSIPETEIKQKTLPVFDNHRIAKRFSHRRERVIKVPDSRILHKTSHYLEAKGITRLLVDGKIYSLSSEV